MEAALAALNACALGGSFALWAEMMDEWEQTCGTFRGSAAATGGSETPGAGSPQS